MPGATVLKSAVPETTTNNPADPKALAALRGGLIKIRDEAADALNRLDADPPTSEDEYLTEKARLMDVLRSVGILAIQAAG